MGLDVDGTATVCSWIAWGPLPSLQRHADVFAGIEPFNTPIVTPSIVALDLPSDGLLYGWMHLAPGERRLDFRVAAIDTCQVTKGNRMATIS